MDRVIDLLNSTFVRFSKLASKVLAVGGVLFPFNTIDTVRRKFHDQASDRCLHQVRP